MTAAPEPKRRGRKRLAAGTGKTARVQLKLTPAEKAAWIAAAAAEGLTLQAWVEARCGVGQQATNRSKT